MTDSHERAVNDRKFRQRVRQHAPSQLMPRLAAVAARHVEKEAWVNSPGRALTPWALAEVARTSLVFGSEQRPRRTTENDVLECCLDYHRLLDPALQEGRDEGGYGSFMLRMAGEQMPAQQAAYLEVSRSVALFEHTTAARPLRTLTGDWAAELLGCSVAEYMSCAFLFYVVATQKAGRFSLDLFKQPEMAEVVARLDVDLIHRVAQDHFIVDGPGFRALDPGLTDSVHPDLRRFGFNPLMARPIISGLTSDLLVPVPGLLFRKASPVGIYYMGVKRFENAFAQDVGYLFEAYVGRQLKAMAGATVLPAIRYNRRGNEESVDWIVVFDDVVVLVEVKSTRPTEAVRTGASNAQDELRRQLGRAVQQLDHTARLIRDQHEAFAEVPVDRPIVGLALTMEPFHVVNAPLYRQQLPAATVPVRVCSAYELERLVPIQKKTAGTMLLEFVNDPDKQDWSIDAALNEYPYRRNPLLDQAWATMPWPGGG